MLKIRFEVVVDVIFFNKNNEETIIRCCFPLIKYRIKSRPAINGNVNSMLINLNPRFICKRKVF